MSPAEQAPAPRAHPKLMRLAGVSRELLEEVRRTPLDDRGRDALGAIQERIVSELREDMPDEIRGELDRIVLPLDREPSEGQLRLAQAQLTGWLEGLFHGVRAALMLERVRGREGLPAAPERPDVPGPGQYL